MKQREYGSSLLEVLVVIVVFSVGILGIVQVFPKALNILKASREGSIAESLAQQKINQIKFEKWKWIETTSNNTQKGFSFEKLEKQKFRDATWRNYLTPQKQNKIIEELIPNQEGIIFLSTIPAENPTLSIIQIKEIIGPKPETKNLLKVDKQIELSNQNYYEPQKTKGLGIYKLHKDLLGKPITVQYKAKDWRILSEDFIGLKNSHYHLSGQNIKKPKDLEADNKKYTGFWDSKELVIINLLNGEILKNNYQVNHQKGTIITKNNFPENIPLRVYYQKRGEWYLQVLREKTDSLNKWIVRVYWNPNYFRFKQQETQDINAINKWTQGYKMIELETF